MKLGVFALIAAVICLVFGLGMVAIPFQVVSLYGTQLDVSGQFMARYFGSALLGLAVMFYMARTAKSQESFVKGGLLGAMVFGVTGLIVSIWDSFAGTHTQLVWLNIVVYAFFTIGFGYFYFKHQGKISLA